MTKANTAAVTTDAAPAFVPPAATKPVVLSPREYFGIPATATLTQGGVYQALRSRNLTLRTNRPNGAVADYHVCAVRAAPGARRHAATLADVLAVAQEMLTPAPVNQG